MKLNKVIILINIFMVFIFFSNLGFTQIVSPSMTAESLLSKDLLVSAKILKNEINIYNYFSLEQVWPELTTFEGRNAFVNRYLSIRAGSFWNTQFNDASPSNYASGPGLYFAIDPVISEKYGNSFIQLKIPAGTRFINVVRPIPLKKETLKALVAEGYLTESQLKNIFPKQMGFYRDTLRMMVLPEYSQFRKLVQNIFLKLNIQFVEYNFNTALMGFCSKHSYSAFVFVGSKNESDEKLAKIENSFENLSLFSDYFNLPNQSESESLQKNLIQKFKITLKSISEKLTKGKNIIKKHILSQYSEEEYFLLKKSIFSCE